MTIWPTLIVICNVKINLKHLFYIELGKGRFGIVFLVEEKQTQVKYAAKFLKIRKRSYREQAVQEISILKILHHENIIKYIDTFIDRQSIIIVMEYVDGGELFMKISQDEYSLTEANCANFISQICHGVEYLHNMSVVHLDLKVKIHICTYICRWLCRGIFMEGHIP